MMDYPYLVRRFFQSLVNWQPAGSGLYLPGPGNWAGDAGPIQQAGLFYVRDPEWHQCQLDIG